MKLPRSLATGLISHHIELFTGSLLHYVNVLLIYLLTFVTFHFHAYHLEVFLSSSNHFHCRLFKSPSFKTFQYY